jgi:hypothetical protein
MVYFEVVNTPPSSAKFQTVNKRVAEREKKIRERRGVVCTIRTKRVR